MEPIQFAVALVDACGGVAEPGPEGGAHLLLPRSLAGSTGLGEEVWVVGGGGVNDPPTSGPAETVALSHGSDALEQLLAAAIGKGRFAAVEVKRSPVTVARAKRTVERLLRPANGAIRLEETEPLDALYLSVGFHYDAVGEERREGLVDVDMDVHGKRIAAGLAERLWTPGQLLEEIEPPADMLPSSGALAAAFSLARARTRSLLEPVYRMQCNRLERDAARLHGYLSGMQQELLRVGAPRVRGDEGRSRLLQRTNVLPGELDRRLGEARLKRSMRVTLRPVSLVLVRMPAMAVTVRLLRRKAERRLTLTCGSLHRGADLPICEGCGGHVVDAPLLCDDEVHLLCPSCHWTCPKCGATTCLACRKRCARCGEQAGGRRGPLPSGRSARKRAPAKPGTTAVKPARPPATAEPAKTARPARPAKRQTPRPIRVTTSAPDSDQLALFDPAEQLRARIVVLLSGRESATTVEIARDLDADVKQVRVGIQVLRREGLVGHTGHGRGTRYQLV
jgi:hypothetical protein